MKYLLDFFLKGFKGIFSPVLDFYNWKIITIITLQIIILFSITYKSKAQTPITAVTTSYLTASTGTSYADSGFSTLRGHTYLYTYGNQSGTTSNDQFLTALTAGGVNYNFLTVPSLTVKIRRVDNAVVKGIRNLKFDEGVIHDSTSITIKGSYDDDMEHFFRSNTNFNSGSDNIFTNQGDGNGNNNNIERVDAIIPGGLQAPDNSKIGLALFERGNTGQHDAVKIAAILSVDASKNPTSYSSIISITSATYGTTDAVPPLNYIIARRDVATSSHLVASVAQAQPFGGIFIKYSDFGIPNGTTIYGYSVIPNDFKGTTSADIIKYTDSTLYPTNTSSADGGIDLVAFTGTLQNGSYSILPVSLKSFTAVTDNSKVNLKWEVEDEINVPQFEVQKSSDGTNFKSIASVSPLKSLSVQNVFNYTDDISTDNNKAILYYRIKFIHKGESDSYSSVRTISKKTTGRATGNIITFPNPVVNNFSVVVPATWQNKELQYSLVYEDGRMVLLNKIKNSGTKFQINAGGLTHGIYTLHITCGTDVLENKIVKE